MPSLSSLIQKRKWNQLSEVLQNTTNIDVKTTLRNFECYYYCTDGSRHHNILHFILSYNPPLSIIRSITEIFPEGANEIDCMNRYPLHIALICGVSANVIRHLIKVNGKAVSSIDTEGKTSLHHLFNDYKVRQKYNSTHFKETRQSFPEIIHMICQHDSKLILKEDMNDMSVLEYAIQEEVEYPILKLLQRIAECEIKGKDLSWFRPPPPYTKTNNLGSSSAYASSQGGKIMKAVRRTITSRTA